MPDFSCSKRSIEKGINWCDESRTYTLSPTLRSRFSSATYGIRISNFGEFYFPEKHRSLPAEGTKNAIGNGLKPFKGKGIFNWLKENTTDKVKVLCRRNYGLCDFGDIDDFKIIVYFASESDAIAFKLWWC